MDRPTGTPCAELQDNENKLDVLIFATHGQFAVYWRDSNTRDDTNWNTGPRHYKSVMGAIRAAYVIAVHQG